MVVGHHSRQTCRLSCFLHCIVQPACSTYPHGRSISPAAIGVGGRRSEPMGKHGAIGPGGIGVKPAPLLHGLYQIELCLFFICQIRVHQCLLDSHSHDGVICEIHVFCKKDKVLSLYWRKLIYTSNYIP